ncbi:MAG: penicillin-binding transpeptidase domain-containing protein, partial [Dehalococcoidia bacterium]|nr:penicillin-binding transpeptidase domain-containing protein [Dehalococcoidia bacterium]
MQDRISRLGFLQLLGFGGAAAALGYWQVVRAPEIAARPDNPRLLEARWRAVRGQMVDRAGRPLAVTEVASDGYVRRRYPKASLGATLGFINAQQGLTGLEAAYDAHLSGRVGLGPGGTFERVALRRPPVGSDLVLTLDLELQEAAERALLQGPATPGACVVVDPRTGALRALATWPTFDANRLTFDPTSDDWSAQNRAIVDYSAVLSADRSQPLLNRPTQGLYAPGSTFKTVTLAAALERGVTTPTERFRYVLSPAAPAQGFRVAWHRNQFVTCQNHPQTAEFDLARAFGFSCNVAFADLGLKVESEPYQAIARQLGMGSAPPLPIPVEASRLSSRDDFFTGDE